MTQKSILSFFVPKNSSNDVNKSPDKSHDVEKEKDSCSADDSPIKIIKSKKRIRITSSSSESENDDSAPKSKREKKSSKKNRASATENTNSPGATSVKNDESSKETKIEKQDGNKFGSSPENGDKAGNEFKGFMQSPSEKTDSYDPFTAGYHPIKNACWKHGEMVPFYALARTFELIEDTSGRMKSMEILSNYLRSVMVLTPKDLLPSIYLTLNKIGPAYEGTELGMSEQTLIQVVAKSSGRNVSQVKSLMQKLGDIGLVGEKIRSTQRLLWKPKPVTVRGIFDKFKVIANTTGGDAVKKKIGIAVEMFAACNATEAKFLMRALNSNLRIGVAELSILKALALACATTPPEQSYPPKNLNAACSMTPQSFKNLVNDLTLTLRTTYCECPNYDVIIPVLLELGVSALPEICRLTVGVPTKPMLAQPTKGVQDVLTRFDGLKFTCEWKYDGERAQIHCTEEGVVKIFSRNLEDNTSKYPDIISRIGLTKKEGVNSFILDCEVVAWNKEENQIMPFQVLSKRKKKDAAKSEIEVSVCVFMFDLLYLNGRSLVKKKFLERRQLLHENFNKVHGEWMFPSFIDTSKMEEVQEFLEESVKGNCEGLMVKTLEEEATYEIAKRSRNWLKLKKDYLDGVGDTLDLVVLGGYLGKGRRTGTYGGFLVGCYDPDSEEYQSVCKLGTGFSDEALTAHSEFFKNHIMSAAPSYYQHDSTLEPDHWFEPVQVWEIKCADISLSPIHRAAVGVVDPEKGISLRFPRFIRIRDDKKPEDATTSEQLIVMYNNQEQVKSQQRKSSKHNEDDFY